MRNKKTLLIVSFALAAVLVAGQAVFAAESDDRNGMGNMMNGNGMTGMMKMMENGNMQKMMNAMNSPEGQGMMETCGNFMDKTGSSQS
jgi:hypothetical protein